MVYYHRRHKALLGTSVLYHSLRDSHLSSRPISLDVRTFCLCSGLPLEEVVLLSGEVNSGIDQGKGNWLEL